MSFRYLEGSLSAPCLAFHVPSCVRRDHTPQIEIEGLHKSARPFEVSERRCLERFPKALRKSGIGSKIHSSNLLSLPEKTGFYSSGVDEDCLTDHTSSCKKLCPARRLLDTSRKSASLMDAT